MNLKANHPSIREQTACPTPMDKAPFERLQEPRRRDGATYACPDGVSFRCKYEVFEIDEETSSETDEGSAVTAPRNGILLRSGEPPIVIVTGTLMSRDMKKVISGGSSKTYAFPSSTITVGKDAFRKTELVSVILTEGLETLESNCFSQSGIRKLVLPSSVESIC